MHSAGLRAVADCGAWYAGLRRSALAARITAELGNYSTAIDGVAVVFTAADLDRTLSAPAIPVATIGADARSLRWAWATATERQPADMRSLELRRTGQRLGLAELCTPTLSLRPRISADHLAETESGRETSTDHRTGVDTECSLDAADDLAALVGAVAVQLTGIGPFLRFPNAAGGCDVALVDADAIPLADPSVADFSTALTDLATLQPGTQAESAMSSAWTQPSWAALDHRAALHGLATRLGWHTRWHAADTMPHAETPKADSESHQEMLACAVDDGLSQLELRFTAAGRLSISPQ